MKEENSLMQTSVKEIKIYTDGACSGNQNEENIGGWGCILEYGEHVKELYGGEVNTTNNRMEMMALIRSLSALKKEGLRVKVFSDSKYLIDCFTKGWYINWMKNGWKTSGKKSVMNKDLWLELIPHLDLQNIEFYHVKGHVSLAQNKESLKKIYGAFVKTNDVEVSFEEFLHVTEMNNRADELANMGMDQFRG